MTKSTKDYKRKTRAMSPRTRKLISEKLSGRTLTPEHRMNISIALKAYWSLIPYIPYGENNCLKTNENVQEKD